MLNRGQRRRVYVTGHRSIRGLRRLARATALAVGGGLVTTPAFGAGFSWFQQCGTNWHDCCTRQFQGLTLFRNNWNGVEQELSCPPLPGVNDDVVLGPGNIVTLTSGAFIRSLAVGPNVSFTLDGGILSASGDIVLDSPLTWLAGSMAGPGETFANAGMLLAGTGQKTIDTRLVHNTSLSSWSGGNIVMGNGAILANSGVLNASGAGAIQHGFGSAPRIENSGTFSKTGGPGVIDITTAFDNSGQVSVAFGTLNLNGGGLAQGQADFTINTGATLNFNNSYTLGAGATLDGGGVARLTGGTLTINDFVVADNFHLLAGTLAGPGEFRPQVDMDWLGGSMDGSGLTRIPATVELTAAGGATKTLAQRTLLIDPLARLSWTGGNIQLANAALLINEGLLDIRTDSTLNHGFGAAPTVNNVGVMRKSAGSGVSVVSVPFTSSGSIEVQAGVLNLVNGSASGPFAMAAGTRLDFTGNVSLNAGASLSGDGLARVAAGTLSVNALVPAENLELQTTLAGAGELTIANVLDWRGGTMQSLGLTHILDDATITFSTSATKTLTQRRLLIAPTADAVWSSGSIQLGNAAIIDNLGAFEIASDAALFHGFGLSPTFNNAGSLTKIAGSGTSTISVPLNHTGQITVQTGVLNLSNGVSSGPMTALSGARIDFTGNFTLNAGSSLNGGGTVRMASGTVTVTGVVPATNIELLSTLAGAGTLNVSSQLSWTSGSMNGAGGATNILPSAAMDVLSNNQHTLADRTLNNDGTTTWTGGNIVLGNGSALNNTGLFEIRSDAAISHGFGAAPMFNNTGDILKTATTGTTTISLPFSSSGSVEVQSGTLQISGGGSAWGDFVVQADAVLNFAGNYTLNTGASLAGPGAVRATSGTLTIGDVAAERFELVGATLTGPGTLSIGSAFDWTNGSLSGNGTVMIPAAARLSLSGAGGKTLNQRTLTNLGSATLSGGNVTCGNGALLNNSGSFAVESDASLIQSFGNASMLNNSGFLRKSAGTGTSMIALATTNTGDVIAESGLLQFTGAYAQTAGQTRLAGGNLQFFQTMMLQGGALRGAGAITGNVSNSGGTVEPGASAGLITISGTYAQAAGGKLAIELGGTQPSQFDRMAVSGAATLGGTLQVILLPGYVPAANSEFTILTAGGVNGTFQNLLTPPGVTAQVIYDTNSVVLRILNALTPGDLNCDGTANVLDINAFVLALSDPAAYTAQYPGCPILNGDLDGDGAVTVLDINPFIALLAG